MSLNLFGQLGHTKLGFIFMFIVHLLYSTYLKKEVWQAIVKTCSNLSIKLFPLLSVLKRNIFVARRNILIESKPNYWYN